MQYVTVCGQLAVPEAQDLGPRGTTGEEAGRPKSPTNGIDLGRLRTAFTMRSLYMIVKTIERLDRCTIDLSNSNISFVGISALLILDACKTVHQGARAV